MIIHCFLDLQGILHINAYMKGISSISFSLRPGVVTLALVVLRG